MTAPDLLAERKIAMHLLRGGHSVKEVAQQLNRSVAWVYKWHHRFDQAGWAGLQGHSQAPKQHGRRLSDQVRQAIVQARSELEAEAASGQGLNYIGAASVQTRLAQKAVLPLPSQRTIERVLEKAKMTNQPTLSSPKIEYPHLHPTEPHQLVQVDIVPHYLLGGEAVACFNAIDVVSRYPTGQALAHRRAQDAVTFLCHVWQEIGLPHYTQVDNEGCFSGGFTHQAVLGQVVRLALLVGTELLFSPVRHPESNGFVERFHQDYDNHVWSSQLTDRAHVNERGHAFFQKYRHSRHHSRLKGHTPFETHHQKTPSRLPLDFELPSDRLPLTSGRVHFMRQVKADDTVSVLNLNWVVPESEPLKGVWVTLELTSRLSTLAIYDTAPDATARNCLATYPFPTKETVQPNPSAGQPYSSETTSASDLTDLALPLNFMMFPFRSTTKLVSTFFQRSIGGYSDVNVHT